MPCYFSLSCPGLASCHFGLILQVLMPPFIFSLSLQMIVWNLYLDHVLMKSIKRQVFEDGEISSNCITSFDFRPAGGFAALPAHSDVGFSFNGELHIGFRRPFTLGLKGASSNSPMVWLEYQSILSTFDSAPALKPSHSREQENTKASGGEKYIIWVQLCSVNDGDSAQNMSQWCFINNRMLHCPACL